jgi:hypothetical protein
LCESEVGDRQRRPTTHHPTAARGWPAPARAHDCAVAGLRLRANLPRMPLADRHSRNDVAVVCGRLESDSSSRPVLRPLGRGTGHGDNVRVGLAPAYQDQSRRGLLPSSTPPTQPARVACEVNGVCHPPFPRCAIAARSSRWRSEKWASASRMRMSASAA